MPENYRHKHN